MIYLFKKLGFLSSVLLALCGCEKNNYIPTPAAGTTVVVKEPAAPVAPAPTATPPAEPAEPKIGQKSEPDSNLFLGTSDGGGGTGSMSQNERMRMLEGYKVDVTSLPAFALLKPIFESLDQQYLILPGIQEQEKKNPGEALSWFNNRSLSQLSFKTSLSS